MDVLWWKKKKKKVKGVGWFLFMYWRKFVILCAFTCAHVINLYMPVCFNNMFIHNSEFDYCKCTRETCSRSPVTDAFCVLSRKWTFKQISVYNALDLRDPSSRLKFFCWRYLILNVSIALYEMCYKVLQKTHYCDSSCYLRYCNLN